MRLPRRRVRTLTNAVALMSLMLGGWRVAVWENKANNCRGWADMHVAIAQAARPGVSPSEAAVIRRNGRRQEIIARKYDAVTKNPWLPYPSAPLVTLEEEAQISGE
jgi:hypothetical protein